MLKYSYIKLKTTQLRKNLYANNNSGLWKDTNKIDDLIFRRRAHTQQDFSQQILNLTGSEPRPHVSAVHFTR